MKTMTDQCVLIRKVIKQSLTFIRNFKTESNHISVTAMSVQFVQSSLTQHKSSVLKNL